MSQLKVEVSPQSHSGRLATMGDGGNRFTWDAVFSILLYSVFSSSMLLVNKLTVSFLPVPTAISLVQILFAVAFVVLARAARCLDVDALERRKVASYVVYVALFALALLLNMKSLAAANVETVIVFRTLTPLAVALLDSMFLGRELPSARAWCGLALITGGAVAYASFDDAFRRLGARAYRYPALYAGVIAVEMTYGKHIVHGVSMTSKIWGPVYYTNVLAAPVMLALFLASDDRAALGDYADSEDWPPAGLALLAVGCVLGTGISYAGWLCRSQTSAATYTVVGVMNKCVTVLANALIWRRHANVRGILSLCVCLVGGVVYEQAPLRDPARPKLKIALCGAWLRRCLSGACRHGAAVLPSTRSPTSATYRKTLLKDHLSDTSLDARDDDDLDPLKD